jgi:hypothetical protein
VTEPGSVWPVDGFQTWGRGQRVGAHPLSNRRVYYNCRFWYVNEYYQTTSARGWQTRIAAFRLPGCT